MESFVRTYDNTVSDDDCNRIVRQFEASRLKRHGHAGPEVDTNIKDSLDLNITGTPGWEADLSLITDAVFKCLIDYMNEFPFMLVGANIPIFRHPETGDVQKLTYENFDDFGRPHIDTLIARGYRLGLTNIQKYLKGVGGYHHWHSEICADSHDCETLHRALFFILYLNDVEEGGQTEFFYQDESVAPKKGRIVVAPAGFTHTHKGHIPESNDKYIATSWVMFQRFK